MAEIKTATLVWQGQELDFHAVAGSGYELDLSSTAGPHGASAMELIVIGLAGCTGMDVLSILFKKRQQVEAFRVEVRGFRADKHPRVFTEFEIVYTVKGPAINRRAVERSIELSQYKYCSVSGMMRQAGIPIVCTYRIEEA